MKEITMTAKEVDRYVIRDAAITLIWIAVYVGLVLWLIPWAHWLAVTLFWIGVVTACVRAVQVFIILLTGVVLFFARWSKWNPSGEAPGTAISTLVRVAEFSIFLYCIYYLYIHLYPHFSLGT